MRYTFDQFRTEYPDDEACLKAVLENRHGTTCPRCGVIGVRWHPITGRKGFVCSECDRQIYPLADTIFRKSETSLWKWFYAIFQFSVAKNGISAKELERTLGVTYKTAWRMARQIRLLMGQDGDMLGGSGTIVQADEAYIGGVRQKRYMKTRNQFANKTAVIGIVEDSKDDGRIKAFTTKQADATVTIPFLKQNIIPGSTIHTDESGIYSRVKRDFDHAFVNHSKYEYAKAGVTTNRIEGFWSLLKGSILGTHRAVSPKYLQHYVNQHVFMYNYRHGGVFAAMIGRI